MIKAVVSVEETYSGCGDWSYIADDPDKQPKLPGVVLEEYFCTEQSTPTTIQEYKHEARLDPAGKPYIHSWVEYHPEKSFDDWCQQGFDHSQIKTDTEKWPKWTYVRTVKKFRWVVLIETLEQLEELLDLGADLTQETYYSMRDIHYSLSVGESFLKA